MTPALRRRLLLVSLVLVCGCNVLEPQPTAWEGWARWKALPVSWKVTNAEEIQRRCPSQSGWVTYACAIRLWAEDKCLVLAEEDEAHSPWAAHERRHCEGYDHAAPIAVPNIRFVNR